MPASVVAQSCDTTKRFKLVPTSTHSKRTLVAETAANSVLEVKSITASVAFEESVLTWVKVPYLELALMNLLTVSKLLKTKFLRVTLLPLTEMVLVSLRNDRLECRSAYEDAEMSAAVAYQLF